jgi:hypothetical protein
MQGVINMSKIKILFKNKWVSVIEKTTNNNGKYIYSTHPWCNKTGVAVLGYKYIDNYLYVLGRYEICPAHSDEIELCALTGGYDNSDKYSLVQCALNELKEEAGYIGTEEKMIYLEEIKPSKASDTTIHLYAIDLNNAETCEATSDGTLGEVDSYCKLVTRAEAVYSKDPLLAVMIDRLEYHCKIENYASKLLSWARSDSNYAYRLDHEGSGNW